MSWSTSSGGEVSKDEIEVPDPHLSPDVATEQHEQYQVAMEVAEQLAKVVGRPGDKVIVTLSGHANPGHAPRQGWANEVVTVSVSAVPSK